MCPKLEPPSLKLGEDYIFVGRGRLPLATPLDAYGFVNGHKIVTVRIETNDRGSVVGVASTEAEDCCDQDDRYLELRFHGVMTDGWIKSLVVDSQEEHDCER